MREREREREGNAIVNFLHSVHLNVSKATIITAILFVTCVTDEKKRERVRKNTALIRRVMRPLTDS
jgi:hypothetical protein